MRVLVGTEQGGVAVSDDGTVRAELDGTARALSTDGPRGCWAALDGDSLARRDPEGRWTRWRLDVEAPITAVLPIGGAALVGTAAGRLWSVTAGDAAPFTGFDRVAGRGDWHAGGSRAPYVRSLSATVDDGAWLASVHVGGIPRSTDGGASWDPTVDGDVDVHQVRAHPLESATVMAAAAVGLLESHDGGATWSSPSTHGLHATYLRAVAFAGGAVLVSASDGPRGHRAALYRRPHGASAFERCQVGLPEWLPGIVDTGALDARGSDVAAGTGESLFASEDSGESWRILASGLPSVRGVALVEPR